MDKALKQRMVGAVVLIALGVIFIPMLLDGGSGEDGSRSVELDIPAAPDREYRSRRLPLDESGGGPAGDSQGQVAREPESDGTQPDASASPAPARQEPADLPGNGESGGGTAQENGENGDGAPGDGGSEPASAGTESPPSAPESAPREPGGQPLGNWFVQVGSFSQQANAEALRDRLRGADYAAFVESSTVEGRTKHRVKVGPEMDRARAERKRDEIRSQFDLQGIVVSEP